MATTINLAPGTQHIMALRARRQRLFMAAAILALAAILIWAGLFLYQRHLAAQISQAQQQVQNIEAQIANLDADAQRIILFEERLRDLDSLLNGHINWDTVLSDIERLLPATTSLTGARMDVDSHTVSLTGSTPDVDQIAVTLASLANSLGHKTAFTQATVSGISRQEIKNADGSLASVKYNFEAKLTFDPNILYGNQ